MCINSEWQLLLASPFFKFQHFFLLNTFNHLTLCAVKNTASLIYSDDGLIGKMLVSSSDWCLFKGCHDFISLIKASVKTGRFLLFLSSSMNMKNKIGERKSQNYCRTKKSLITGLRSLLWWRAYAWNLSFMTLLQW